VTKAGFEPIQREVKLSGGDEATVEGPMQPEVTTGHLVVNAPAQARVEVLVDGGEVGPAPWEGDVKPGIHVVEARGADRFSRPKQVDVGRRDRVEMVLELIARTGRVQIDTHTTDATIAVDGETVGRGVWEGSLPAGEHKMVIAAPGYHAYTRAFLVHEGETFVEDTHLVAQDGAATPRYEGIYAGLAVLGFATPTGASNGLALSCPASCQYSSPLGGGLAVRVGYSFGWIAVEGLALGSYDYATGSAHFNGGLPDPSPTAGARTESYAFHRFGGGGAIGVRVASKHPNVRLTASALGGVATMGNIYDRTTTPDGATSADSNDQYSSPAVTYVAPLLVFDAGVLVGWANGAKMHASIASIVQLVGDSVFAPPGPQHAFGTAGMLTTPQLTLAQGTQLFIGPMIGFDLGL
jgi:hypothetical protein